MTLRMFDGLCYALCAASPSRRGVLSTSGCHLRDYISGGYGLNAYAGCPCLSHGH